MSDETTGGRVIRLRVRRQDHPHADARWEEFAVPYRPNLNIIACLQSIAANPVTADGRPTTPVVYDSNCLEEICGACTMLINGRVRQACSALIDKLVAPGETVTLEPMSKFPIVRDLFVDRQRLFDALNGLQSIDVSRIEVRRGRSQLNRTGTHKNQLRADVGRTSLQVVGHAAGEPSEQHHETNAQGDTGDADERPDRSLADIGSD